MTKRKLFLQQMILIVMMFLLIPMVSAQTPNLTIDAITLNIVQSGVIQSTQQIDDGDSLSYFSNPSLTFIAELPSDSNIESVRMTITGPVNYSRLTNEPPYSLANNAGGYIYGITLPQGDYTLTVIPYQFDDGTGAGESHIVNFSISVSQDINMPSVNGIAELSPRKINSGEYVVKYTIRNEGGEALTISDIQLTGDNSEDFSLDVDISNAVMPGDEIELVVTFRPVVLGIRNATVTIISDDPDENPYSFTLLGEVYDQVVISDVLFFDYDENQPIYSLEDNAVIDLAEVTHNWRIRVEVTPSSKAVDRIEFTLDGDQTTNHTEGFTPYDFPGTSNILNLLPGSYSLAILPVAIDGTVGTTTVLDLTVVNSLENTGNPPILAAQAPLSPADDSTDVPINASLAFTLNQPIQKGSGDITIHQNSDDAVLETIPVASQQVVINSSTVTINPLNDLPYSTDVYVKVPFGAFENGDSQAFVGFNGTTGWNFTTAADTLRIESFSLYDATTDTFIREVQDGDIVGLNVTEDVVTFVAEVPEVNTVSSVMMRLNGPVFHIATETIAPYSLYGEIEAGGSIDYVGRLLLPGHYTLAAIPRDQTGREGLSQTISFIVIDVSDTMPPQLAETDALNPANGAVNVSPTLETVSVTFDGAVQRGTGNITLYENDQLVYTFDITDEAAVMVDGGTVSVDLTQAADVSAATFENDTLLDAGKAYAIQISDGAIIDDSLNVFAGIANNTTWRFSTTPRYDVNYDGVVTPADAVFVLNRISSAPPAADLVADVDLDGDVDQDDVDIVLQQIGESVGQ